MAYLGSRKGEAWGGVISGVSRISQMGGLRGVISGVSMISQRGGLRGLISGVSRITQMGGLRVVISRPLVFHATL